MDPDAPDADDGEVLHDADVVRKPANRGRRRFTTIVVAAALIAGAASGSTVGYLMHSTKTVVTTRSVGTTAGSDGQVTTDPLRAVAGCVASINTSVVGIRVWSVAMDSGGLPETAESEGSGFVFATGGLIATSAHVIADASQIEVVFADGTTQTASVVGKDTDADLAVVHIDRSGLEPLSLATGTTPAVGDFVIAAGNALALEGTPSVRVGIISALDRSISFADGTTLAHLIQTDAAISSGDSGGPLLTASGAVVGINTASAVSSGQMSAQNIGFAIPITRAAPILAELARAG